MGEYIDKLLEKSKNDNFMKLLGIKILKIEKGFASVTLKMREDFLNFNNLIHGGIIYSVADVAFSLASNSLGIQAVALQVNVNFLKPVNLNDELIAEVRLKKMGKTVSLYEMEVFNAEKSLVASLIGNAFQLNNKK
ncbi:MAG: hotdog fold thioesterase [Candidatus Helarchaeota archaeon]|nr:hotdog fold thioesterase [Candidatus Helarchaeota archaeon]